MWSSETYRDASCCFFHPIGIDLTENKGHHLADSRPINAWKQEVNPWQLFACNTYADGSNLCCFSALSSGYRRCANGYAVPENNFCDKKDDCFDNSDETAEECKGKENIGKNMLNKRNICDLKFSRHKNVHLFYVGFYFNY